MKAQDLTFHEIENDPPSFLKCHSCGARGVRLGAVIPLPDKSGDVVVVTMCSPACVSVFKRNPKADAILAAMIAKVESVRQVDQWPQEVDG